jgi:hypothetical protein
MRVAFVSDLSYVGIVGIAGGGRGGWRGLCICRYVWH